MLKDVNTVSTEKLDKAKKPYSPCKVEIIKFNEDVMLASAFPTRGEYDDLGDWNPFNNGLW